MRFDFGEGGLAECAVFSDWNRYIVLMFGHNVDTFTMLRGFAPYVDAKMQHHNLIIFSFNFLQYLYFAASQSMHLQPRITLKKL